MRLSKEQSVTMLVLLMDRKLWILSQIFKGQDGTLNFVKTNYSASSLILRVSSLLTRPRKLLLGQLIEKSKKSLALFGPQPAKKVRSQLSSLRIFVFLSFFIIPPPKRELLSANYKLKPHSHQQNMFN